MKAPVSVIVPAKNEERNIRHCLQSVRWADQVCVIDSSSTDSTCRIAEELGAKVFQFHYDGGWPKKRQWAMDNLPLRNPWVLLLDADEAVSEDLKEELIAIADSTDSADGYWLTLRMFFLGRELRHGASGLKKMSFFRKGKGRFEKRFVDQDHSMADIEVHEHVLVDGKEEVCRGHLVHHNFNTLDRYIHKHNQYSNWGSKLYFERAQGKREVDARRASLFGNQSERRRFLKNILMATPGSPLIWFVYFYVVRLGLLDGRPGLIYCCMQAIQHFHVKAKLYELRLAQKP
jgi:glycosyltransferase involved in cell wall biosynthesis